MPRKTVRKGEQTPTGSFVKQFVRLKKVRYYEKTENGCVELSRAQYNERKDFDEKNTYARI